jgi:hypothetical protein
MPEVRGGVPVGLAGIGSMVSEPTPDAVVRTQASGALDVAGIAIALVGFVFETVGDAQMARFSSDSQQGAVMDRGLWHGTRHPDHGPPRPGDVRMRHANRSRPEAAALAGIVVAGLWSAPLAADEPARVTTRTYVFRALLDDKPIGEHRFDVVVDGAVRKVASEADFSVRFLGFRTFHYHHHADEEWAGDCLVALSSTTDDDGKPASVHLERDGDVNQITTTLTQKSVPGCLMSYAYWNPALRDQTRLLDPQTGKVDSVHVDRAGSGTLPVDGKPVAATRYRIVGADTPIDVWYSDRGEWIGLDWMVSDGKRKVSYRLP